MTLGCAYFRLPRQAELHHPATSGYSVHYRGELKDTAVLNDGMGHAMHDM